MTEPGLNPKLQKIYDYISSEITVRGYAPSVREIGGACGISSSSTVHGYLKQLENLGLIKRDPAKPRAMVLAAGQASGQRSTGENGGQNTSPGMVLPEGQIKPLTEAPGEPFKGPEAQSFQSGVFNVPLAGIKDCFTAGGSLNPPRLQFPLEEQFFLQEFYAPEIMVTEMADDSMININLFAGDRIVVKLTEAVSNGDVVLVIYQNQALVRTYYKGIKQIRLQPENDEVEPISALSEDLMILGKVLGLLRKF